MFAPADEMASNAGECVDDILQGLNTIILQAADVGAREEGYCVAIALLLARWVPLCEMINLVACADMPGEGTPDESPCWREVASVGAVIELCGGTVDEVKGDRGHLFSYCWTFKRVGTSPCTVQLQVFKQPEKVNNMANSFRPKKQFAAA